MSDTFDAFISHASEDKAWVRPLAKMLTDAGYKVWYDEFQLKVGDSLRRSIDRGLAKSRFGIVILSPSFFAKQWPQYELNGLASKEMEGGKVILPVWHGVSKADVMGYSPPLADKLALDSSTQTIDEIVAGLASELKSISSKPENPFDDEVPFDIEASPNARAQRASALCYQGKVLAGRGKYKEAIAVYDEVVRRYGQDASPDVRKYVAAALAGKAVALGELGRIEEVIAVCDEVVRRYGQDDSPGVREVVGQTRELGLILRK